MANSKAIEGSVNLPAAVLTASLASTQSPGLFAGAAGQVSPIAAVAAAALAVTDAVSLARELEAARNIQESLLPKVFPTLTGFELAGYCRSARQIGGDFYDAFPVRQDCAMLVVADVMGKGVPAALFAATLRTLIRTMAQWTDRPADILRRINELIHEELSTVDMFITAQIALVDVAEGSLTLAAAGHCPLLVGDGSGRVEAVSCQGLPLGILKTGTFSETKVPLGSSSCALLYTDGVTDTRNPTGDLFGEDRLAEWLRGAATGARSAVELKQQMLGMLRAFEVDSPLRDDQTFIVLAPDPAREVEQAPARGWSIAA